MNITLIPPCNSYGDTLAVIPLLYYLLNSYEKVTLVIEDRDAVPEYYKEFFKNEPNFNKRIFVSNHFIRDGDVCDCLTGEWSKPSFRIPEAFNCKNPLPNILPIDQGNHVTFPLDSIEINHEVYYKMLGLNNHVRLNYFDYYRNIEYEKQRKSELINKFDITGKYCIINDPYEEPKLIKPNSINISHHSGCLGDLLSLIEDSEEIHLIEGFNCNFLYHCQYKGIFKYTKPIYLHVYLRNRNWTDIKLDYAWKMYNNPKLPNWNFIFEEPECR